MFKTIWLVEESLNVSDTGGVPTAPELIVILFELAFAVASTIINFILVDWARFEIAGKLIVTGPVVVSHSNLTSWNWSNAQEGFASKLYVPVIIILI